MDALLRLMTQLFDSPEALRMHLLCEPRWEEFGGALPLARPLQELLPGVLDAMLKAGALDAGFFDRLPRSSPEQADEIRGLKARFAPASDEMLRRALCMLLDAQQNSLVFELGAPAADMPSMYAPQSARAEALLRWAQSQPQGRAKLEGRLRLLAPAAFR